MRRQGGQTLVEFALVASLMLVLLMGIFDLGRALYFFNVATNVAREGARYASSIEGQNRDEAAIAGNASTYAPGLAPTVTVRPADPVERRRGQTLTVTVQIPYRPITPLVPGPLTLTGRAVARSE